MTWTDIVKLVIYVLVDKILFTINLHDNVVETSAHKYHPGCVRPWFIVIVRLIIAKVVCHIKPSKKRNAPAKKTCRGILLLPSPFHGLS